jgi:class 3 adenylate cyclase/PAS domain-containing protein
MSDDTLSRSPFQRPVEMTTTSSNAGVQTAPELLRNALQTATEAMRTLRDYRNSLRALGMNLPNNAVETLKTDYDRLDAMLGDFIGEQTELRQLRALAERTALFNSAPNLDSVLEQVMDTAVQLTGAERGFVLLKDPEQDTFEFRIARGIDRAELDEGSFTVSRTILDEIVATGQPVITNNARSDPRYDQHASVVGYQLRSILAVPLKVQASLIGVLYCDNRVLAGLFKPHDLALLESFADQAAVAIQNARLFETARDQLAAITTLRDLMDNIFISIGSGLIAVDATGRVTVFNRAAESITAVSQALVLGHMIGDALPAFTDAFRGPLEAAMFQGVSSSVEQAFTRPGEGEPRIWNARFSRLRDRFSADETDETAVTLGVVIVLDDLTEQRAREARLAEVRHYLPSALVDHISSDAVASLEGEEREISVVFSDVRGFTAFSETLEPEDLMRIINRYLTAASDAIDRYEGIVDKYIGDAVTALFNTQLNPQPDHALRAVYAALQMQANVETLHGRLPPEQRLFFGIGVHTGAAVLGNVGSRDRREFAALGDAVEMSKLLQENAERGEIILSEQVYQQVRAYIACEPVAPRKTKGRTDIATVYRVVGVIAQP